MHETAFALSARFNLDCTAKRRKAQANLKR
jgi:hypothetical protein